MRPLSRWSWAGCLLLALGSAAGSAPREPSRRGGEVDLDDPQGRARARERTDGDREPADQLEILRIAEQEAARYGLRRSPGVQAQSRVGGAGWVSLGPTDAAVEKNGSVTLNKVDSGRARRVLVHPTNPDLVYLAVSGGGVWKTFNATNQSSSGGPSWEPITEAIGSLAVGSIAMNPTAPDSLLLGLGDPFDVKASGLLHSEDGGQTWSAASALSGSYAGSSGVYTATSVRDLAFDPGGSGVVLAATNVGLFRATDFGQGSSTSWTLIDVSLGITGGHGQVQACWSAVFLGGTSWLVSCVDQSSVDFNKGRIFKSTDGGASFADYTARLPGDPTVSPADPDLTGLGRISLAAGTPPTGTTHTRVYALAENGPAASTSKQKDVFRSDDGGETWSSLGAYAGSGKAPTNPFDHPPFPGQTDLDVIHTQASYNQAIVVDPHADGTVFIGGDLSLLRSRDGGSTWDLMSYWLPASGTISTDSYVHADWHTATISYAGGGGTFYGGSDGGLFASTNVLTASAGSALWTPLNKGLVTHLVYSVASAGQRASAGTCSVPAAATDLVLGGLQDNGTRLRAVTSQSGSSFNQITGGDGFGVAMGCCHSGESACTQPGAMGGLMLATYVRQVQRSVNGGGGFSKVIDGTIGSITLDANYNFVMWLAADHADPAGATLLVPITSATDQTGTIWSSSDGGQNWSQIGSSFALPAYQVMADGVTAGNWAATTRVRSANGLTALSQAMVKTAGDSDWTAVAAVPVTGQPTWYLPLRSAALDPADPSGNTLWAGSGETRPYCNGNGCSPVNGRYGSTIPSSVGHVFRTGNARAGASAIWTVQAGASSGLPNVPVNIIRVDPGDPNTVYVGTEIGLYRGSYNAGSTSWTRLGNGLPLVSVTDLALAADSSWIRIATYGRGFWELFPRSGGSTSGAYGDGDLDGDQQLDGFDLVREAALLYSTSADADYNWVGHLVGSSNAIGTADITALVAKLGGRP
jgi:hypothetical protein